MSVVGPRYPERIPLTCEEKAKLKQELKPILMDYAQKIVDLKERTDRTIELADRNIKEAQGNIKEAQAGMNAIIVTLFHRIFYGKKPVPEDQIDSLFATYLADASISFEESKNCFKLNSVEGVVRYLKDHTDIKQCDFRAFKTEISDLPTLAEFLKNSTVKAIALNSGIPNGARASLDEAVAARKGGLRVQYFA